MDKPLASHGGNWSDKFRHAFRGLALAVRHHSSFWVHGICAVSVVAAGLARQLEPWQWSVLAMCMAVVLVAEMHNTALEHLAKAVDAQFNPHIRDALDVGSAAVLMAASAAVVIGAIVFWYD